MIGPSQLQSVLQALGERVPPASHLLLTGGSALVLPGSPRLTLDLDFIGDDVFPSELHKTIVRIAGEMKIPVDVVPLERFVPLPQAREFDMNPGEVLAHLQELKNRLN